MASALAIEVASKGGRAWWVAPSYPIASVGWREVRSLAIQIPGTQISESDKRATLLGGGWIQVRSADNPDSLRGEGLDFVVIDEAAFVAEEAWSEALRPALADRQGRALFISTPKGRNWFWRAYERGRDGQDASWRSWTAPTSANPFIAPQELLDAKAGLPERVFRQEFLAEFLEDGGSVFRAIRAAVSATKLDAGEPGRRYIGGLDLAKSKDFSVLTILDDEAGAVVFVDRFNSIDYTIQKQRIVAACGRFRLERLVVERNSIGEPIIEDLQRSGLPVHPFTTTNATKSQAIDALALAFERGDIRIPNHPILIAELESFEMSRLPGGTFRYSAPSGMHDDCVMSLAFAWHAHTSGISVFAVDPGAPALYAYGDEYEGRGPGDALTEQEPAWD